MYRSAALGTLIVVKPAPLSLHRTFHLAKQTLCPLNNIPPSHSPSPWQPSLSCLSLWNWLLPVPHMSGIIEHLSFGHWLISLNIISSRFSRVGARIQIASFLKLNDEPYIFAMLWLSVHRRWTPGLQPPLSYCEQFHQERGGQVSPRLPALNYFEYITSNSLFYFIFF